jgi:hypothetical protein
MADIIIIRDADEETINRIMNNQMEHGKGRLFHNKARESVDIEEKVEEKTIKEKKYVKMQKFVPNKFIKWTKKEDKILRENYSKKDEKINYKSLTSVLPERTIGAIIHRAWELKITNPHRKRAGYKRKKKEQTMLKSKWAKWTAQEDNILREQYKPEGRINWKEIRKQMPHRTKGSIMVRACQLKITNKNRLWGKKATRKARKNPLTTKKTPAYNGLSFNAFKKTETQKQEDFIKKRSTSYQKQGHNEQDSRRMAMTDYQNFKGHKQTTAYTPTNQQKKATIIDDFPEFESIDKQWQPLIEGIVKHIIANKGSKLSYLNTRDILDVSSGKQWHDFVAEFMIKSNIISEYFNVQNKFRHQRTNEGFDIITYES